LALESLLGLESAKGWGIGVKIFWGGPIVGALGSRLGELAPPLGELTPPIMKLEALGERLDK